MARIAVCQTADNVVANVIVAEITDPPYLDTYFVEVPDGVMCDIGWVWTGTEFFNPNPPPPEEPSLDTEEQLPIEQSIEQPTEQPTDTTGV